MTTNGYLVQYGRVGFVGRFTGAAADVSRGTLVVVRGPRGVELGTVLCPVEPGLSNALDTASGGTLLRVATDDDRAAATVREATAAALLANAERQADAFGLPVSILDAEVVLDSSVAILHALPTEPCNADGLLAALSATTGLAVQLYDVSRTPTVTDPPEPNTSCGKPDCGSGSGGCTSCHTDTGGCSTGGCSRGSVKSADELTTYFADLRTRMEARRTPLT